jgi:hypothetical protein
MYRVRRIERRVGAAALYAWASVSRRRVGQSIGVVSGWICMCENTVTQGADQGRPSAKSWFRRLLESADHLLLSATHSLHMAIAKCEP